MHSACLLMSSFYSVLKVQVVKIIFHILIILSMAGLCCSLQNTGGIQAHKNTVNLKDFSIYC